MGTEEDKERGETKGEEMRGCSTIRLYISEVTTKAIFIRDNKDNGSFELNQVKSLTGQKCSNVLTKYQTRAAQTHTCSALDQQCEI